MKYVISLLLLLSVAGVSKAQPIPAHKNNDILEKMGYIDSLTGKWVIPPVYDFCRPFGPQGTAVVFKEGKAGYVNLKGVMIIPATFDDAQNFNEDGIAIVRRVGRNDNIDAHNPSNDRFGAIDKTGKMILPYVFTDLNDRSFPQTLIGRREGQRWGILSSAGKVVVPFEFDMINVHKSREVAIMRKDTLLGVMNSEFTFVVPMEDNMARFAGNGLISLYKDGLYGYCNFNGEMVIDYQYSQFAIFREGLCILKKNGFFGYIDTLGNTIIPFEYDGGEPFVNDTAIVLKQGKMGMINPKNEILVEFIYDKISRFYFPKPPGGFLLIKRDEWFYIDPVTHEIVSWDNLNLDDPNLNKAPEKEEEVPEKD